MDETASLEITFDEQSAERAAHRAEDAANKGADRGGADGSGREIATAARQLSQAVAQLMAQMRGGNVPGGGGPSRPSPSGSRRGGGRGGRSPSEIESEERQKDRLSEKISKLGMKGFSPAERLDLLKETYANAEPGTIGQKQARYDLMAEQDKQERVAKQTAARQKKADEDAQFKQFLKDDKKAKTPPPLPKEYLAQFAKGKNVGKGGVGGLLQNVLGGKLGTIANLLGGASGGSSALGGLLGSIGGGASAGAAGSAAGGMAGLAGGPVGAAIALAVQNLMSGYGMAAKGVGQAGRALVSGDTSGFMKGGIGAVGGMVSAGAGPIFGPLVRQFTEALQAGVDALDNFTAQVAEYNGTVAAKQADLDAATMGFQMKMADAGEGLASSWIDLKESVLSLMEDLVPVVEVGIDILKVFVDAIKDVVDFVHQFIPSSGKPRSADIAAAANAGMVSDLNVNGDAMPGAGGVAYSQGSSGGTYAGLSGGGGGQSAPSYRLPGGNGTGFHLHQTNQFAPQDQASVEMVLHQLRELILDPMRAHGDRVTVMGGMMGARVAMDLNG